MSTFISEAKRRPGSEWMKDRASALEKVYDVSKALVEVTYPWMKRISPGLTQRFMVWMEKVTKGYVFNCQMCGQCILHSTGMTCSMNCPKNLRNGPCGGVRANGRCEVFPELPCIWVQAWERSQSMGAYGHELRLIQPPVNHRLKGSSAWANMMDGIDQQMPAGWVALADVQKQVERLVTPDS